MATIIIIVVFIIAFLVLAWSSEQLKLSKRGKVYVQCVEAGGSDKATPEELNELSYFEIQRNYRDEKGNFLNSQRYTPIVVHNNCMVPRNIYDKDVLLVENIKNLGIKNLQIGDILYLKINKNGKDYFKIRELRRVLDNQELETCYYDLDRKVHISSQNHTNSMVLGVVRYNLSKHA